jgi:hypothetical protein
MHSFRNGAGYSLYKATWKHNKTRNTGAEMGMLERSKCLTSIFDGLAGTKRII